MSAHLECCVDYRLIIDDNLCEDIGVFWKTSAIHSGFCCNYYYYLKIKCIPNSCELLKNLEVNRHRAL